MPNVLEAVMNILQSFIDEEPKPPLHIGEAMSCWTMVAGLEEAVTYEEAALNTTDDPDVKEALIAGIHMCQSQSKRLRAFMQKEGIPLPPTSEPKPRSDSKAIPVGVKLTDNEIVNGVSIKVASSIVAAATSAAQSIRNDVGAMWVQVQAEQMTYSATLKALMKKRGWLKIPPYYVPPGMPDHNTKLP